MYGDTDVIRGLAGSLRTQGDRVRVEADTLLHLAETTPWRGLAAEAMRARARDGATALRRTADLHADAADALVRHADEVDRRKALIARIEHEAMHLVDEARSRLSGLLGSLTPSWVDQWLDGFQPPPPGHRDWLTVQLPFAVPGL